MEHVTVAEPTTGAYLDPRDWHTHALHHDHCQLHSEALRIRIAMASFIQNILVVFPPFVNAETARPTHTQAESYPTPTTVGAEEPIYFYDSDKPYFESAKLSLAIRFSHLCMAASPHFARFTSFSDHPVEYHGLIYPTAEHRTLSAIGSG
jgi:hypothetical protein